MAKHLRMILYLDKVQELLKAFPTFTIQQVPRAENAHADALASLGSALDTQFRRSIPVEHLDQPSIEEAKQPDLMQIDEDPSWQDPIIDYLVNENLPNDKSEARKIKQKAARYYMKGDMLIRRSYYGPHLTCIKYLQTLEVLCKIHDDECGNHAGGRSLAQKALNIGYFWPTMRQDSTEYARRCDRCQRYKPVPGQPAEEYHPQNSPWPFMQWAIDLVGPMPTAPANKEMMIVATDYFTKWIEAEALSSTKEADVERFIWKNIICRFGCPQSIVTDNGTQFVGRQTTAFLAKQWLSRGIQQDRAGLPKGKTGMRKRKMGRRATRSLMGLSHNQKEINRRDHFPWPMGTEAIIPPHITVPSMSIEVGSLDQNCKQMKVNLDLSKRNEERSLFELQLTSNSSHLKAIVRVATYQQQLTSYHSKKTIVRAAAYHQQLASYNNKTIVRVAAYQLDSK
ncbi:unnamed protein product [Prunus armeniaca]